MQKEKDDMNSKFLFTLIIVAVSTFSYAQPKVIQKANAAFAGENFSEATKLCADAYAKTDRNKRRKGDMAYKCALSYRYIENYAQANEWFEKCILLDYQDIEPEVYLHNADMLVMMTLYDKAIENYNLYLNLVPDDARADIGIESCNSAKAFVAERTRHIVKNMELINVEEFDMAPMWGDRKKSKMYYSTSRDGSTGKAKDPRSGEGYMDIWVTSFDKKGNPKEPKKIENEMINTVDNEGTICFDQRFKLMFFTRCPNKKKTNLGCNIWMANTKGKDGEFEDVRKVEISKHDTVSVGHPCTIDGKFLIFASDLPGGFGGRDLWYVTYDKKAETWSAPTNMGPEINTKGNELFPSFGLNGELIYASDGMPGLGGLDIFKAAKVGESNKWENPTNLGAPINGTGNDYALIEKDGRHGYFTSERKSQNGEYVPDLYSYELPPNLFSLKVIVSELSNPEIKIEDVKIVVKGSDGKAIPVGFSMKDGSYFWDVRASDESRIINEETKYTITISKDGYHEDKKGSSISTIGEELGKDYVVDMALLPKTPIRLPEVRYPLNEWVLLNDTTINSPDSLQYVFDLLEEYPNMLLELSSHTDSRGSDEQNRKLSVNRAKACYKYLIEEKGLDPRRIVPVGKGETQPRKVWLRGETYLVVQPVDTAGVEVITLTEKYINSFKSSDRDRFTLLHQLNRRTEGRVINMEFDPATAPAADPEHLKYIAYP
jgi:outer membrane protein OmpA-like peptidoglycan-associated protein/tetratricopeptide (TPR) repeat protein